VISIAISLSKGSATAVRWERKKFPRHRWFSKGALDFLQEQRRTGRVIPPARNNDRRWIMPFLIPVLVGIPVLFGGGYIIYHLVH
jgi:hypothetical protein